MTSTTKSPAARAMPAKGRYPVFFRPTKEATITTNSNTCIMSKVFALLAKPHQLIPLVHLLDSRFPRLFSGQRPWAAVRYPKRHDKSGLRMRFHFAWKSHLQKEKKDRRKRKVFQSQEFQAHSRISFYHKSSSQSSSFTDFSHNKVRAQWRQSAARQREFPLL